MTLRGEDVDLTVQRSFQGGVDSAFRDALQIGLAQGHVDDVETVVAGYSPDLAGKPESGQHAMGVVVGSPADIGDDSRDGISTKSLGTQIDRGLPKGIWIVADDQQLHFAAGGRHRRDVGLHHLSAGRPGKLQECGHALV